jgi:hypothetical protein
VRSRVAAQEVDVVRLVGVRSGRTGLRLAAAVRQRARAATACADDHQLAVEQQAHAVATGATTGAAGATGIRHALGGHDVTRVHGEVVDHLSGLAAQEAADVLPGLTAHDELDPAHVRRNRQVGLRGERRRGRLGHADRAENCSGHPERGDGDEATGTAERGRGSHSDSPKSRPGAPGA